MPLARLASFALIRALVVAEPPAEKQDVQEVTPEDVV